MRRLTFYGDWEEIDPQNTCSYAYSYAMWKKNIEGLFDFSDVDNGRKIHRNTNNVDLLLRRFNYIILKGINKDITNYVDKERNNTYKMVLHRVLGHILFYWYVNWLLISNEFIKNGKKYFTFSFEEVKIPFYLIKFPEIQNGQIEFHWWIDKAFDLNAAINNLKCPYV